MHPNFYPNRFLDVLITNHNDFVAISKSSTLIHFYQLESTWGQYFNQFTLGTFFRYTPTLSVGSKRPYGIARCF
jgi:hypothetical protein